MLHPFAIACFCFYLYLLWLFAKYTTLLLDYVYLPFIVAILLHYSISTKISTGFAVYFWDAVFALTTVIIYSVLMGILFTKLPKVAKAVNYLMVIFGLSITMALGNQTFLSIARLFDKNIHVAYVLPLLNSEIGSQILFVILVLLLSIPIYGVRMRKLGLDENASDNKPQLNKVEGIQQ